MPATETKLDVLGIINATAELTFREGSAKVAAGKFPVSLEAIESRTLRLLVGG